MDCFFWCWWSQSSRDSFLHCFYLPSRRRPSCLAEHTTCLSHRETRLVLIFLQWCWGECYVHCGGWAVISCALLRTLKTIVMTGLTNLTHGCSGGPNTTGGISHFLIGLGLLHKMKPIPGTTSGQEPVARQIIGPKVDSVTIPLLNEHHIKFDSCWHHFTHRTSHLSIVISEASICSRLWLRQIHSWPGYRVWDCRILSH